MDTLNNEQLKSFLHYFSDNPLFQAAIVIILGLIIAKLVNVLFSHVIQRIADKTHSTLDNHVILIARPTLFYSILLIALALAINLTLSTASSSIIYSLLKSFAVILWAIFFIRLTRILLTSLSQNPNRLPIVSSQTLPLFMNLVMLLIAGAATYFFFSAWNIDMTAWLASAGIIGIAVGFAAKDTLANLFAGVFILADAPYKIGDYVVLDTGERGEVTHIGIRSTRILTRDDVEVTIPNSIMGNTKIINESGGPHKKYRIRVQVGVAYGTDIDKVKQVLMEIANHDPEICDDPEPRVRFRQFGNSSLEFELLGWINEPMLRGRVIDALNGEIYKRFQAENIEIPFNKQDIYIKSMPTIK